MPQELVPIVDKPLIQYAAEEAIAAGIDTLIFLVNERGELKGELKPREHKSLQTDRVILMPGPEEEIAWVIRDGTSTRAVISSATNRRSCHHRPRISTPTAVTEPAVDIIDPEGKSNVY
jgi:NDP-sugar pyrophosphorylase family protein